MTEMGFAFYSSCPTIWCAPFDSEQMDGWLDFLFLYNQRFRRTLHVMITLVFNACMEWIIIPQRDGYYLGWHGQKIPFPLFRPIVPLVAIKRGWLDAEDMQDFPYLRLETQIDILLIWKMLWCCALVK